MKKSVLTGRLISIFLVPVFILPGLYAQRVDTLTLPALLRLAGDRNPLSKQKQMVKERLTLDDENLLRAFYPELNLNAQAAYYSDVVIIDVPAAIPGLEFPRPYNDQYSVTLDVRQMIYDGGFTRSTKAVREEQAGIEEQDVEVKIYTFKQRLSDLFFSALFLDENYSILKQNMDQLEAAISEAQAARDHGVILTGDLNVLLAAKLDMQQKITANRHDRQAVTGIMSHYLDTLLSDDVILTVPPPVTAYPSLSRPEMRLFMLQSSMLDANIRIQDAMRKPRIVGFGQLGYGRPGLNPLNEDFNTFYLVGAKFSWNIWDWNRTARKKKVLSIQKEQVIKQEDAFRRQVEASLIKINEEIRKLDDLIVLDRQKVDLRKQISGEYAGKLSAGTITPAEYERQLTAFQQAQIQLNLHRTQKLQKQIEYLVTNGNLSDYENRYK